MPHPNFRPDFSEQKPQRRRQKPRRIEPSYPPLDYFNSQDLAFFEANPNRCFRVRRCDDDELWVYLKDRKSKYAGRNFHKALVGPRTDWPLQYFVACRIVRGAGGYIDRQYVSSGIEDDQNEVCRCLPDNLDAVGEQDARNFWFEAERQLCSSWEIIEFCDRHDLATQRRIRIKFVWGPA